jgi:hypothetical protein
MLIHGKGTYLSVDGADLSQYTSNSQLEFTMQTHDVTTYGKNRNVFHGGLGGGTITASGFYDNTATTGPRDVLEPLAKSGEVVPIVHRPEGTGAGKPQDTVDGIITKYTQTHPVNDMVTWSIDIQMSDDVNSDPQPA